MTSSITPAHLGFLAIYNPSLASGSSEDALDDQIFYYASPETLSARRRARRKRRRAAHQRGRPTEDVSQEERNERLRQIGLAQGMVEFSRGFAGGDAVDFIETEKGRVVVREVEPGWWILASVDLTRVPLPPKLPVTSAPSHADVAVEYSSRDMKSGPLLLRDLLRAHSLFLLHHDVSLESLLSRLGRRRFVSVLTRYWDLFLSTWSICLHGNPIRNLFGGINVAASGELGVGVGEEERGSGEREVLEGLVGRVEGLVDVVVSKFAEEGDDEDGGKEKDGCNALSWLGAGRDPGTEDGAVFLGVGALSRKSLTDLTHWVEDLYTWGDNAYGVIGAPSHTREDTKGKGKKVQREDLNAVEEPQAPQPKSTGEATEQVQAIEDTSSTTNHPSKGAHGGSKDAAPGGDPEQPKPPAEATPQDEEGHMDRFVNILKLGYGTYWTLGGPDTPPPTDQEGPKPKATLKKPADESEGYFLLGLKGTVEEHPSDSEDSSESPAPSTHTRTLHVHVAATKSEDEEATPLRAVVYVVKPFIFTFLFRPDTPSLASDTLYRSLHYQLSPLRKPLLLSTTYRPPKPTDASPSMYDLVFDPEANTTHSTIPNIPPGTPAPWTRSEAAATHAHLLALHAACRPRDVETTARTNKGWWIVWNRVAPPPHPAIAEESSASDSDSAEARGGGAAKEVILLKRAGESRSRAFSGSALMGETRLGQGIGFDTRGYIEGLLSLGR